MFWRCMLLRLCYFINIEGAKTQKTVTRSVLPLLRKCTHARCYTLLHRIMYTLQHYKDLKTLTQKQTTGRSFIRFCLLWWQGTISAHDYHFQTAKGQISIAQLNQSEPRSAACRAEYYTQLSDPHCMTCWHQWRRSASFVLTPCFSRVMNRKTLG